VERGRGEGVTRSCTDRRGRGRGKERDGGLFTVDDNKSE
jgi:hypothetical protein